MPTLPETLTVESPERLSEDSFTRRPVFARGACLGRYVVLEAIGGGGMGDIFSAYDPELDRKVAIKILHRHVLMSEARESAQARLRREARAVAKLPHPNVVGISPRPWRRVVEIFEQAGRGLAAAHRVGLVHRDFKPTAGASRRIRCGL